MEVINVPDVRAPDQVWEEQLKPLVLRAPLIALFFAVSAWFVLGTTAAHFSRSAVALWLLAFSTGLAFRVSPWIAHRLGAGRAWVYSNLSAWLIAISAAFCGALLIAPPLFAWSALAAEARADMVVFVVGFSIAGSLTLASLPRAAMLWVGTVGVVLAFGVYRVLNPETYRAAALTLGFIAVLLVILWEYGRSLKALHLARYDAIRQRTTVEVLLQDFQEEAREWLWETNTKGTVVFASPRMAEVFNCDSSELIGQRFIDILTPVSDRLSGDGHLNRDAFERIFSRNAPFRNHVIEIQSGTATRWFSISAKPLVGADGEITGWRGTGIDVTSDFTKQREMERLAMVDSLTGLANRLRLNQEIERFFPSLQPALPCALLLLDLDDFKYINDHFGHPTGDRLLQQISQRLSQQLRAGQLLARLGGDEFAMVISGDVPRSSLAEMGERIVLAMAQPHTIEGLQITVRCSIGIAIGGIDAHDAKSLLKSADLALYAAKNAGRNAVRFFGFDMHRRVEDRFTLTEEIRNGIDRNEFELLYQPFVSAAAGAVTGFEALLRWNHPTRGILRPEHFVGVAEETSVIGALGAWVFKRATHDALKWPEELRVAINVSAAQFSILDLRGTIERALTESELDPKRLEVEITESTLFEDGAAARRTMLALRSRGVQISLDDFGAGHASLNHLRSFPITRLKIDRSFTATIADTTREGNESRSIVRAAIELARAMELESTAEGVETAEQMQVLKQLYCDELQGYFVAYPMANAEVLTFLQRQSARTMLAEKAERAIVVPFAAR